MDRLKSILADLAPLIRSWGFRGSGQNYRKLTDRVVLVINFQKSSGGEQFYVNLGAQPVFVPAQADTKPDPKSIKEYDCIFRKRVAPPEGRSGWPYDANDECRELLRSRMTDDYHNFLTPLTAFPGALTEFTVDDFTGTTHPLLGGRHASTFLNLARIALATGQPEKAMAFAKWGIQLCSKKATGLMTKLEAVLAEVANQPTVDSSAD